MKFPKGLPNNFDKKLSFAKTTKEELKVNQRIEDLGFTKINYVGESCEKSYSKPAESFSAQPHWRREYLRN